FMRWGQQNDTDNRLPDFPPTVTIFGAGVAGLSAAHELVERGFNVNIVEQTRSPTEEYACRVGGVAANQVGRVKIELDEFEKLHGKVKEEEFRSLIKFERSLLMQLVQQRFPINQQILFDRNNPDDPHWLDKPDDYGVTNCEKLLYVNNILQ